MKKHYYITEANSLRKRALSGELSRAEAFAEARKLLQRINGAYEPPEDPSAAEDEYYARMEAGDDVLSLINLLEEGEDKVKLVLTDNGNQE